MKKLIINADDFGWDVETTATTIELMNRGIVKSATIMVGMPASEMAMSFAKRHSSQFSFGLHFNIVDGMTPLSDRAPSLLDKSGKFRTSHRQRVFALLNLLNSDDIRYELDSQINVLKTAGVMPSHIDSHGHLHKFPKVSRAIRSVLNEHGIKRMRRSQNVYFKPSPLDLFDTLSQRSHLGFLATEYFMTIPTEEPDWLPWAMSSVPDGLTELGVHPGLNDRWRAHETKPLLACRPSDFAENNIELYSYNDV